MPPVRVLALNRSVAPQQQQQVTPISTTSQDATIHNRQMRWAPAFIILSSSSVEEVIAVTVPEPLFFIAAAMHKSLKGRSAGVWSSWKPSEKEFRANFNLSEAW